MGRGADKRAEQMAQQNQQQAMNLQTQALTGINDSVGVFTGKINELLAKNPWLDPTYKRAVTGAASTVASGTNKAAEQTMLDYAGRTGTNSGNITASVDEMRRAKARGLNDQLTATTIADNDKAVQLKQNLIAMLGQVPGAYGAVMGGGNAAMGAAADLQRTAATTGSWYDNLVSAGLGAAGSIFSGACPVEGSLILMWDGKEKPVEKLRKGDAVLQMGGSAGVLLETPSYQLRPAVEIDMDDDRERRVSETHGYAVRGGGYVEAKHANGWAVAAFEGEAPAQNGHTRTVTAIRPCGIKKVYPLKLSGNKTYCADGVWSLE